MPTVSDLGRMVKKKYPGTYDDLPDSTLGLRVQQKHPGAYDDFTPDMPQTQTAVRGNPMLSAGRASDVLPSVGGTIGGVGGGALGSLRGPWGARIGSLAGAGLGGGVGELAREALSGQPLNVKSIIQEGEKQMVADVAGRGLARGARFVGKAMMQGALRPTLGAVREFPKLVETMTKERIPVGKVPLRRTGSDVAMSKMSDSAEHLRVILDAAEARGVRFTADDLLGPVKMLARDVRKQPLASADIAQLRGMVNEFVRRHNGVLTPVAVKELKQRAFSLAKPVLKAERAGNVVTADRAMEARFHRALGKGARRALETIPNVTKTEARTQSLIGAHDATRRAEDVMGSGFSPYIPTTLGRGAIPMAGAAIGGALPAGSREERLVHAIQGGAAAGFLGAPPVLSRMALMMTDPAIQFLLSQILPRGATSLLLPPDSTQGGNR